MSPLTIVCPHCGEKIDIENPEIEPGEEVEFVADCEVCCRPIDIRAIWPDDEDEPFVNAHPA